MALPRPIPKIKRIRQADSETVYLKTIKEPTARNGEVPVLKFKIFDEYESFLTQAFSTRYGGTSVGYYEEMDLSFHETKLLNDLEATKETREHTSQNFEIIGRAIGIRPEQMVYSRQTHTTNVRKVGKKDAGMGVIRPRDFTDTDGLITNEPGVCLVTSYADCNPVFFVDPVKKAIGASHAGWRGTFGNIAKVTIEKMQEEYGTNPADLRVFIGPGICGNCYEVGHDVSDRFKEAYTPDEAESIIEIKDETHDNLNLLKANYLNCIHAGVSPDYIAISDICTMENPELLFSHRASKGKRGTLCGFLMLK